LRPDETIATPLRAIGARQRDILRQFLFEATGLSLIGGAVGVLAGVVATRRELLQHAGQDVQARIGTCA
jgi:ABC-type lipoprotein release transport system permease subunit